MSAIKSERRHAPRLQLHAPSLIEVIGQRDLTMHPNLAAVYERVAPATGKLGEKFPAVLRDLSTNGAFVAGEPLPLMSRLAFTFPLEGHGQVEVLGWVMPRRNASCEIPQESGPTLTLAAGFGVLFEAIPLDARLAISRMVDSNRRVVSLRFRFAPRFRGIPWLAAGIGLAILIVALVTGATGSTLAFAWASGIIGPVLGLLYWRSPAWRLVVELDEDRLRVVRGSDVRLELAYADMTLRVDREHKTCVVDGGSADKRMIVPGPGLQAPYRIVDRERLVDELCARVPTDRQQALESPR